MKHLKRKALLLLAVLLCAAAMGCDKGEAKETVTETTPIETTAPTESEIGDETTGQPDEETKTAAPEETKVTVSKPTEPLPHEAELVTNPTVGAPLPPLKPIQRRRQRMRESTTT